MPTRQAGVYIPGQARMLGGQENWCQRDNFTSRAIQHDECHKLEGFIRIRLGEVMQGGDGRVCVPCTDVHVRQDMFMALGYKYIHTCFLPLLVLCSDPVLCYREVSDLYCHRVRACVTR